MQRMRPQYPFLLFLISFFVITALIRLPASLTILAPEQNVPTPTSISMSSAQKSWLILNLPPGATQLEHGAEIYRLVCESCHGDKGQGLTPEWRATWAPADQNCWKSKCHAANHPPDGFSMPAVPALAGATAMSRFYTAQDLQAFIAKYMPWHNPGSLNEEEYWQVTAYVLKLNDINPGGNLDTQTAIQIKLGRSQSSPPLAETQADGKGTFYILALVVALLVLFVPLSGKLHRTIRK